MLSCLSGSDCENIGLVAKVGCLVVMVSLLLAASQSFLIRGERKYSLTLLMLNPTASVSVALIWPPFFKVAVHWMQQSDWKVLCSFSARAALSSSNWEPLRCSTTHLCVSKNEAREWMCKDVVSHVRGMWTHAWAGRVPARVLRHTVMDQTGLPCSVLCAVFPFKSGRLAHVGSLGFSCRQLSEPWQAVLTSGGWGTLCSHPHHPNGDCPALPYPLTNTQVGLWPWLLCSFSNYCIALMQFTLQCLSQP